MSNKFVKKTVAVTTTVATTLSLSGISLLMPMFVATAVVGNIMEGDTIKTANNPDVYIAKYVGSKMFKRLILNPQVFESYGHLSWGAIKTVSEADMAMLTESKLVRAVGDPKVYELSSAANSDTGLKKWVNMTGAEFVAQGYDWDSIYEINGVDRDNYTASSDITPGTTTPPVTGPYSVKLSSGNPAAGTLMDNSAFNEVLRAEVVAGSSAVNITSITVERFGITQDTDISGIGIFDSMGVRHGNVATLGQKQAIFDFPSNPISIAANSTGIVSVRINITDASQTGTVGMKLVSMTGTPSGLPVSGNEFSLANGANILGAVEADINTQNTSQVSVNVGVKDQLLTKLSLGETTGSEDVYVKSVTFQQNGSAADSDVSNWELVSPLGAVIATVSNSSSKLVKFNLSPSWMIDNGTTDVFDVRVDVVNGTSRTVQAVVQNNYDIELVGKDTGVSILPSVDTGDADDASFPIGDVTNEDTLSIGSGTLTLSKASSSPSGSVAAGATDVTLAKFDLKVEGEDMEVRQIDIYLAVRTAPDNGDSGTTADESDDIFTGSYKVVKSNGSSVYSVAIGSDVPDNAEATITLSSYFIIPAGTTETLSIMGNLREDLSSADSFQWAMQDVYVKRMVTGDFSTQATSEVTANTLTGTTGTLTVVKNESIGNQTSIGGSNTLLGSFILQSGSAEGVNITSFQPDIDAGNNTQHDSDLDSWWLEIDNGQKCDGTTSKRFGSIDASVATTSDSFTGSFVLPVSSQAILDVCGDVSSTLSNADIFEVDFATTEVAGTTLQSQQTVNAAAAVTGQAMTMNTSGTLKVSVGTLPVAGIMNTSDKGIKVLEMSVSPLYEGTDISEFRFWEVGNTHRDWTNVSLYRGATKLQTKAADSQTRGVYDFTGLTESVAAGATQTYSVYVDSTDANASGKADVVQIYFGSLEAKGKVSGVDLLEYDNLGYGGAVSVEPGNTSSVGHYRRGDAVFTNNAHGTSTPFGVVVGNENEASSTSVSGLDLGFATNTTFSATQYIVKVGGAAIAHAPRSGLSTTGIAANDFVLIQDASANTVYAGMVGVGIVADVSIPISNVNGTTTVTLAAADTTVEFAGTGYNSAGTDFATTPATGSLIYYFDVSDPEDSTFGIVTTYDQDITAGVDAIAIDGTGLVSTVATTGVAVGDRYFAFTMDINSATYTTNAASSTLNFSIGDLVYHYDASAPANSNFTVVTTGIRAGETMANLVTAIATMASGDRIAQIAPRGIGTNSWTMHDAEPIATVDNSGIGTASQQAMQDAARYKITAVGGNLTIESLNLTVFGSGADALTASSNGIEVWVDGVREIQTGNLVPVAETGTDFTLDFANEITIISGTTKTFLVKLNTLGHSTVNETVSVKLGGNKGYIGSPIDFYYTSTGTNGTVPTASSPANINDSELPLIGVTVTP